jgi:hypothetical protein
MSELVLTRLRELAEPLVALSTSHLSPATRQLLQEDHLSVNAYPTLTGGFVCGASIWMRGARQSG